MAKAQIVCDKLLSVRFQGLLERNGCDWAAFFFFFLNFGGEGGVKFDGFRSFGSGVILGEVMNCEGAWAFPRSVSVIMKEEPLLR